MERLLRNLMRHVLVRNLMRLSVIVHTSHQIERCALALQKFYLSHMRDGADTAQKSSRRPLVLFPLDLAMVMAAG